MFGSARLVNVDKVPIIHYEDHSLVGYCVGEPDNGGQH